MVSIAPWLIGLVYTEIILIILRTLLRYSFTSTRILFNLLRQSTIRSLNNMVMRITPLRLMPITMLISYIRSFSLHINWHWINKTISLLLCIMFYFLGFWYGQFLLYSFVLMMPCLMCFLVITPIENFGLDI